MLHSNHYDTLNISPSSSADEIKKAFRQLAMQYHPDITNNDELKAEKFRLINQAYLVLSDTDKRKAYDAKHFFPKAKHSIISLESILESTRTLKKKINLIHPSKLNYDGWGLELDKLVSGKAFDILSTTADSKKKEEIIINLNDIIRHLPYKIMLAYSNQLQAFAKENDTLQQQLLQSLEQKKKEMYWEKYKIPIAIGVAIAACLLIVFLGKL